MLPTLAVLDHMLHMNLIPLEKRQSCAGETWRAPDHQGRHALWIAGHIAAYRHRMLRLAGLEPPTTLWESHVQPGTSAADLPSNLQASTVLSAMHEAGQRLNGRFHELTKDDLERNFGGRMPDGATTVFGALRCLVRHETLHVGQISLLLPAP